jgi:hypothetical protein
MLYVAFSGRCEQLVHCFQHSVNDHQSVACEAAPPLHVLLPAVSYRMKCLKQSACLPVGRSGSCLGCTSTVQSSCNFHMSLHKG